MHRLSLLPFVILMLLALTVPAWADGDDHHRDDDRKHEDEKKDDERHHDDEKKDDERHHDEKKDDERHHDEKKDDDRHHDDEKKDDEDRDANEEPEPWLPDGLHGFAGVLRGRVVRVFRHGVLIKVERVARWRHNKAENPRAAIGKELLINVGWVKGDNGKWHPNRRHMAFLHLLRRGMRVDLDVRNDEGDRLHLVELNAEQRRAVERELRRMEREEREARERREREGDGDDEEARDRRDDEERREAERREEEKRREAERRERERREREHRNDNRRRR